MLCRSKDARWTPGKGAKVFDDRIGGARYANKTWVGEERNDKAKGDSDRDRGGRKTGQKIKVHSLRKNKGKNFTVQRLRTTITFG